MANITTLTHDLNNFTRIDMRAAGDIHLTQGQDFQVEVSADEQIHDILDITVEDETLIIKFEDKKNRIRINETITYTITMPIIAAVTIAGGGSLHCERIAGKSFELNLPGGATVEIGSIAVADYDLIVPGGAKVKINQVQAGNAVIEMPGSATIIIDRFDADNLDMKVQGAGNISLSGRVITQNIVVPGVGNIKAGNLQSDATYIRSMGVGNVTVWANHDLDVSIKGMGRVRYYGDPKVKKSSKGFGSVKRLGDAPVIKV